MYLNFDPADRYRITQNLQILALKKDASGNVRNELMINPELLYQYFRIACGVNVNREWVCRDYADPDSKDYKLSKNHVPPFEILRQLYNYEAQNAIIMRSRGSGKTLDYDGVLSVTNHTTKFNFGAATAGAVVKQAEEGYQYFYDIINNNDYFVEMSQKLTKDTSKTIKEFRSRMEIVISNKNGFNCKHPNTLMIDEFELLASYKILDQAVFMPKENKARGYKPQLIYFSSLKSPSGLMMKFLKPENLKKMGFKAFISCVFEVAEKCTGDRSCSRCLLNDECNGRLKKRKEDGHMTIDNIIFQKRTASKDEYLMQTLCRKLKPTDTVYGRVWDREKIVLDHYYEINPNWETVGGADFGEGGAEPNNNIRLAAQIDQEKGRIFIFKEKRNNGASGGITTDMLAKEDKEWTRDFKITKWFVDPRGGPYISSMHAAGLEVITMLSLEAEYKKLYGEEFDFGSGGFVRDGIIAVSRMMKTGNDKVSLFICPSCMDLIEDLETNYVWEKKNVAGEPTINDKPDKKCSHGPDALRYIISNIFPYFHFTQITSADSYENYMPMKNVLPQDRVGYIGDIFGDDFYKKEGLMSESNDLVVLGVGVGRDDFTDFGGF